MAATAGLRRAVLPKRGLEAEMSSLQTTPEREADTLVPQCDVS